MVGYLRPTAEIAADALLPGDPGRALRLAQELLVRPRMSNHHRGLWGYSGRTESGLELTIQATGIGGPSVAAVLHELAGHGVRRAVRLGTCEALDPTLRAGELLAAREAIAAEGASMALGAAPAARPDPELGGAFAQAIGAEATVASADLAYDPEAEARRAAWSRAGAVAVEMGSATLFTLASRLGIAVASGLVVAVAGDEPLADEQIEHASLRLGALAVDVLARSEDQSAARASEVATPRPP